MAIILSILFNQIASLSLEMIMNSARRYYTDESYRQAVHKVREEELAAY
jgi:hypothetical protein